MDDAILIGPKEACADTRITDEQLRKIDRLTNFAMLWVLWEVAQAKIFSVQTSYEKTEAFFFTNQTADHSAPTNESHNPALESFFNFFTVQFAISCTVHYWFTRTEAIKQLIKNWVEKKDDSTFNSILDILQKKINGEALPTTNNYQPSNAEKTQVRQFLEELFGPEAEKHSNDFICNIKINQPNQFKTIEIVTKILGFIDSSLPILTSPKHVLVALFLFTGHDQKPEKLLYPGFILFFIIGSIARLVACFAYYAFRIPRNIKYNKIISMLVIKALKDLPNDICQLFPCNKNSSGQTLDDKLFNKATLIKEIFRSLATALIDTAFVFFNMLPSLLLDLIIIRLTFPQAKISQELYNNKKTIAIDCSIFSMAIYATTSYINTLGPKLKIIFMHKLVKTLEQIVDEYENDKVDIEQATGFPTGINTLKQQYFNTAMSDEKKIKLLKQMESIYTESNSNLSLCETIKYLFFLDLFCKRGQNKLGKLQLAFQGAFSDLKSSADTSMEKKINYGKPILPLYLLREYNVYVFCTGVGYATFIANFTTWTTLLAPEVQNENFTSPYKLLFIWMCLHFTRLIVSKVYNYSVPAFRESVDRWATKHSLVRTKHLTEVEFSLLPDNGSDTTRNYGSNHSDDSSADMDPRNP